MVTGEMLIGATALRGSHDEIRAVTGDALAARQPLSDEGKVVRGLGVRVALLRQRGLTAPDLRPMGDGPFA
jgi:hypothetical protein